MTEQHPITPPPKWQIDAWQARIETMGSDVPGILLDIAQWGADQELEACCELLVKQGFDFVDHLRAARRPKPPRLKEQGFTALQLLKQRTTDPNIIEPLSRAVEALSDDQH